MRIAANIQREVARPGRFELPTLCLEGRRSIQLSYGRIDSCDYITEGKTSVHLYLFCRCPYQ
jgi:hypothetical protein